MSRLGVVFNGTGEANLLVRLGADRDNSVLVGRLLRTTPQGFHYFELEDHAPEPDRFSPFTTRSKLNKWFALHAQVLTFKIDRDLIETHGDGARACMQSHVESQGFETQDAIEEQFYSDPNRIGFVYKMKTRCIVVDGEDYQKITNLPAYEPAASESFDNEAWLGPDKSIAAIRGHRSGWFTFDEASEVPTEAWTRDYFVGDSVSSAAPATATITGKESALTIEKMLGIKKTIDATLGVPARNLYDLVGAIKVEEPPKRNNWLTSSGLRLAPLAPGIVNWKTGA